MTAHGLVPALSTLEAADLITPTGLNVELLEGISYEEYERLGEALTSVYKWAKWALVDWLIFGEGVFADRVAQAVASTGLSERRIRNLRSIGLSVPPSRRVLELSVDWHAEVSALKPKDQRRWLARAKREHDTNPGFTQRDLRDMIREERVARGEIEPVQPGRRVREIPPDARESVGLPDSYVLRGPLCRRLVREAVGTGDAWCKVPRALVNEVASVIGEDPI